MTYNITYNDWEYRIQQNEAGEIKGYNKRRPIPMRPVAERVVYQTLHFVIMEANTTPCHGWKRRGKKLALIELAEPYVQPTRIDKRLKSIRQIIVLKEVFNLNHRSGMAIRSRYFQELVDLADKCERLYPCHFLIKGINYEPPKTFVDG